MRVEDMELFERIAAVGSVSAAGKTLGLSPTVASERLARLEKELSCTLAHRTTRKLTLTEEGRNFLAHVRPCLSSDFSGELRLYRNGGSGSISV